MVDVRRSGRIFKQVKRSGVLTDLSHDLHQVIVGCRLA